MQLHQIRAAEIILHKVEESAIAEVAVLVFRAHEPISIVILAFSVTPILVEDVALVHRCMDAHFTTTKRHLQARAENGTVKLVGEATNHEALRFRVGFMILPSGLNVDNGIGTMER